MATATAVVVTGNYRAWRHFIGMRATEAADTEIRELAVAVLDALQREAPSVFADFRISTLPDGSRVAASPLVGEG
jgi:thymidylate synthase (FAD)